jgi:hypothetical protein
LLTDRFGQLAYGEHLAVIATCETQIICEARHSDLLVCLQFHEEKHGRPKRPVQFAGIPLPEAVDDLYFRILLDR